VTCNCNSAVRGSDAAFVGGEFRKEAFPQPGLDSCGSFELQLFDRRRCIDNISSRAKSMLEIDSQGLNGGQGNRKEGETRRDKN